jgi:thioredoxin-like negative regulator of GroEL
MAHLPFITAEALALIARRGEPVVVAFIATWNRRCQAFAADYEQFAAHCNRKLPVVCVDVDECSTLTGAFNVCSVPTTLLLRGGVELYREVGIDLGALCARIDAMGDITG